MVITHEEVARIERSIATLKKRQESKENVEIPLGILEATKLAIETQLRTSNSPFAFTNELARNNANAKSVAPSPTVSLKK